VIPVNSLHISSLIIFGVIRSLSAAFFGFSCFLMAFTISSAQKKIGSLALSVPCDGRSKIFVSAFGWNRFRRCWAKVSTLTSSLRAQVPKDFLIRVTTSIGEISFGWSLHKGCFVLIGDNFSTYRRWASSSSCFRVLLSLRVASLKNCFNSADLLDCLRVVDVSRLVWYWLLRTIVSGVVDFLASATSAQYLISFDGETSII